MTDGTAGTSRDRDFSQIQADLDTVTKQLKENHDPQSRRELLARMRVLLEEAIVGANSPP